VDIQLQAAIEALTEIDREIEGLKVTKGQEIKKMI
jgi:hypothetical protein